MMIPKVECYAGSTYPEKPRVLEWEGQRYFVDVILERRREPHGVGFLVRCIPERYKASGTSSAVIFDLFYDLEEEQWQIQLNTPRASQMVSH